MNPHPADYRATSANCWRCHGLMEFWPAGISTVPIACPTCAGTGLEMIPMTELFVHCNRRSRLSGPQKIVRAKES